MVIVNRAGHCAYRDAMDRSMMLRVFISSVQKELAAERRAVKEFIRHDPLLSRFIGDVFLEVWNPGELPRGLTPEKLREPHGPIPRNPLIAEPLFRVILVEKTGTGTELVGVARKTAMRDLSGLVESGVLDLIGSRRGTHYTLAKRKK